MYKEIISHKEREVNFTLLKMLTSLLIIPILGVLALSPMQDGSAVSDVVRKEQESRMKQIALFVTLLNFIVSLVL